MAAERRPGAVLFRWVMVGEWRARPGRFVLAILAIAIGVALGLAVHLVNRSALDEFARAVRSVSGEADLQVHAASALGFPEGLYPRLARAPGVAAASPVVELRARAGNGAALTLLGVDVIQAAQVTPSLAGQARRQAVGGEAGFDLDSVFLSEGALRATGLAVGGRLRLTAAGRTAEFTVAGTLPGEAAQPLAVLDIAAAQWRFGQLGRLQRIDLRLAPGADRRRAEQAVRARLPPQAELATAQSEARRSDNLSRAYRVNLQMLAMVALLTGGFLVYSAQSLSVARRRPQFALLRVLGLRPRGILAQVVAEGAVLGVAGGAIGVAAGVALAGAALNLFGGDLGGGYFSGERPRLVFTPIAAGVIFGLGFLAALGGSLFPALEAARAPAAVALKAAFGEPPPGRPGKGALLALGLLAASALAALAPAVGGLPLFGYLSIALMLAGGVGAMPWLVRTLLRPLRPKDPSPFLALARLRGAPGQAAIALCGIVASTSLMIAMAVMVSSFRGSVDQWLGQVLPADLYMRAQDPAAAGLDPAVQRALASAPGVASVEFRQSTPLRLSPDRPAVNLVARRAPGAALPLIARASGPAPAGAVPVWPSEPMARLWRLRPGQALDLPLGASGAARAYVAGVWRDYSNQFGALAIDERDYARLTGDPMRSEAVFYLRPGARPAQVMDALRRRLPPVLAGRVNLAEPRQLRAFALRLFDRSFALTYALEAIAIGVGLAGVAATFSAQTLARRKEFGMLRHVGVLRREIVLMLAAEGALVGAIGAVAGAVLGLGMSQVLIRVVNPQSFNWTMDTRLPWPLFAGLALALPLTSAGAAVLAGRGAVSQAAVQAVREDW